MRLKVFTPRGEMNNPFVEDIFSDVPRMKDGRFMFDRINTAILTDDWVEVTLTAYGAEFHAAVRAADCGFGCHCAAEVKPSKHSVDKYIESIKA